MTKELKATDPENWIWFGNAAHFICGMWCRFHLATQVGKVLVSTVGQYVHPRHGQGREDLEAQWLKENWPGEDIGCDRKYETMVFLAGEICTLEACGCGLPAISGSELDFRGYNRADEANLGHREMCELWASEEKQSEL